MFSIPLWIPTLLGWLCVHYILLSPSQWCDRGPHLFLQQKENSTEVSFFILYCKNILTFFLRLFTSDGSTFSFSLSENVFASGHHVFGFVLELHFWEGLLLKARVQHHLFKSPTNAISNHASATGNQPEGFKKVHILFKRCESLEADSQPANAVQSFEWGVQLKGGKKSS